MTRSRQLRAWGSAFTRPADGFCNGGVGDDSTPGIIDEAGAFQVGVSPLGPAEIPLLEVTMTATAGGIAEFFADPADIRSDSAEGPPGSIPPDQDTLIFEPPGPVPIALITYGVTSVEIEEGVAGGEGEFTNQDNHMDVNNDGNVSPIDALLVMNWLNFNGLDGIHLAVELTIVLFSRFLIQQASSCDGQLIQNLLRDGSIGARLECSNVRHLTIGGAIDYFGIGLK